MAAIGMPIALAMPDGRLLPRRRRDARSLDRAGDPPALVLEDRGELVKIRGMAETIKLARRSAGGWPIAPSKAWPLEDSRPRSTPARLPGIGPGASITLIAEFTNAPPATFVGLGKRGKPAEAVADEAVAQLLDHLEAGEAAVDLHSADQILLPLAFAEGRSVFTVAEVTEHLRTNVATIGAFLDRPIRIEEADEGPGGRVVVG